MAHEENAALSDMDDDCGADDEDGILADQRVHPGLGVVGVYNFVLCVYFLLFFAPFQAVSGGSAVRQPNPKVFFLSVCLVWKGSKRPVFLPLRPIDGQSEAIEPEQNIVMRNIIVTNSAFKKIFIYKSQQM